MLLAPSRCRSPRGEPDGVRAEYLRGWIECTGRNCGAWANDSATELVGIRGQVRNFPMLSPPLTS